MYEISDGGFILGIYLPEDLLQRAAEEAASDLALQENSNNKTSLLEALSHLSNLFPR